MIVYELSMPNVGSWNGKWTGEKDYYAKIRKYTKNEESRILSLGSSHYYNFGDGWGARVSLRKIDAKEASSIRNKSSGFCGYEWMIDSIEKNGEIIG